MRFCERTRHAAAIGRRFRRQVPKDWTVRGTRSPLSAGAITAWNSGQALGGVEKAYVALWWTAKGFVEGGRIARGGQQASYAVK